MIEVEALTERDVGRRVLWQSAPGVEIRGHLASWWDGRLVLATYVAGQKLLQIVEDVDPADVSWVEELRRAG
jgi:hypothetical protein